MNILVDADATPSISLITDVAREHNIPLILYCDQTHSISNDYATVKIFSKGFQSVDMAIINEISEHDILITQDFGLATLALSKKCIVISPKGMIYTDNNIDKLNFERYLSSINRKANIHMRGPRKRTKEDDNRLLESLHSSIRSTNEGFKS